MRIGHTHKTHKPLHINFNKYKLEETKTQVDKVHKASNISYLKVTPRAQKSV